MFSLRDTLKNRKLPPGYNVTMGIVVLIGRRPASITQLRNSPCPESAFVHFKSLIPLNNNINQFIDRQFIAMQRLFAEGNVAMLRGTSENLSGNPVLQPLQNLDVGTCRRGETTQEQRDLFANRNNVGNNQLVVYIVLTIVGVVTNPIGCATHPNGQPGAAVVVAADNWLVAHEVGHVLGLRHVCEFPTAANPTRAVACIVGSGQSDSLMFPRSPATNVPPDLSATEYSTMQNSPFTNPC